MAPHRDDDRTRSPPREAAEEKKAKTSMHYTAEEWDEWRKEQETWRKQQEQEQARWEERHMNYHALNVNRDDAQDANIAELAAKVRGHSSALTDLRETTTLLAQWTKDKQVEESTQQVKLLGWRGETRAERRQSVERWLTLVGGWPFYDHVKTLENKATHQPLSFSLLVCKTSEDRPDILRRLEATPINGLRGSVVWGRKNIPRYQREGGALLRFVMSVIEEVVPNTEFSYKGWPEDAVQVAGQWVAAIVQTGEEDGKQRAICIDTEMYEIGLFTRAATRLWDNWGGNATRSSSTSTSSTSALLAPQPRVYYVQDHANFIVVPLEESHKDNLTMAKAEREERDERRALERRGFGHSKKEKAKAKSSAENTDSHIKQDENMEEEQENPSPEPPNDGDQQQVKEDKKGVWPYDGSSSDEEMLERDSAGRVTAAKLAIKKIKEGAGGAEVYNKGKPRPGSSAEAIFKAKSNVSKQYQEEQDYWATPEGYWDQRGNFIPHNSGAWDDYEANLPKPKKRPQKKSWKQQEWGANEWGGNEWQEHDHFGYYETPQGGGYGSQGWGSQRGW